MFNRFNTWSIFTLPRTNTISIPVFAAYVWNIIWARTSSSKSLRFLPLSSLPQLSLNACWICASAQIQAPWTSFLRVDTTTCLLLIPACLLGWISPPRWSCLSRKIIQKNAVYCLCHLHSMKYMHHPTNLVKSELIILRSTNYFLLHTCNLRWWWYELL